MLSTRYGCFHFSAALELSKLILFGADPGLECSDFRIKRTALDQIVLALGDVDAVELEHVG